VIEVAFSTNPEGLAWTCVRWGKPRERGYRPRWGMIQVGKMVMDAIEPGTPGPGAIEQGTHGRATLGPATRSGVGFSSGTDGRRVRALVSEWLTRRSRLGFGLALELRRRPRGL